MVAAETGECIHPSIPPLRTSSLINVKTNPTPDIELLFKILAFIQTALRSNDNLQRRWYYHTFRRALKPWDSGRVGA